MKYSYSKAFDYKIMLKTFQHNWFENVIKVTLSGVQVINLSIVWFTSEPQDL